jgi:hypothetical protein
MVMNIGSILSDDNLVSLVQSENFIGWAYALDYDKALVLTNDYWKSNAMGIPHNCFLVATSFNPEQYQNTEDSDKEVILLRVIGTCKLPQEDDLIRTKIDYFQQKKDIYDEGKARSFDDITQNQLQFGGLECRVLGTFYTNQRDGELRLGSDLESFEAASRLRVYRPRNKALNAIVNYVDPDRKKAAKEQAEDAGIKKTIEPFPVGKIRYTSTDRLHRKTEEEYVTVNVQPSDFLARRTAVLGMTRTGKSNMIKQLVSVVKRIADNSNTPIGQIIYDINGEYANANQQDKGSIADVYSDTVRYRMLQTVGFEELQNNFYIQLNEGMAIIRDIIRENKNASAGDVEVFLNLSLDEPDPAERGHYTRWKVKSAAYKALLKKAGFLAPTGMIVKFEANRDARKAIEDLAIEKNSAIYLKDPKDGLTLDEAVEWFTFARDANKLSPIHSTGTSGGLWLDDETLAILNMLRQKNSNDAFIKGYTVLKDSIKYHSPRRDKEVGAEIYQHLKDGKIVILDLSVGNPKLREKISQQIARDIFNKSMDTFIHGKTPPNIVVYIEEAHNLIGKGMDLTDTWPRLAKEGAKYKIALVYATQEVSSMHPNILANTENWFITHLNNDREIKELARFYDFEDFSRSLLRAQDVGFARVKTLSSPFVIPVQIDKFDPKAEKLRVTLQGI